MEAHLNIDEIELQQKAERGEKLIFKGSNGQLYEIIKYEGVEGGAD